MVASSPLLARRAVLSDAKRGLLDKLLKDAAAPAAPPAIPRRLDGGREPLSFSQQSLWFFHRLDPQSPLYNLPVALQLTGPLDIAALQRCLNTLAARHDILRTRYVVVDEMPVQQPAPPAEVPLGWIDLSTQPVAERAVAVRALIDQECRRPFDLTRDAMLRGLLVGSGEKEHTLVLTTHHIAADGWSWGIFFRELAALYGAALAGQALPSREPSLRYGDYAAWQRAQFAGPPLAREVAYWETQLAGAPALLELPTDHPRPAVQAYGGGWERRTVAARLTDDLRDFSRREGVTVFVTLLATFKILLHRLSGQTDIVVGTAVAGRSHVQLEDVIGCFVNTLPLRSNLAGDPTFHDFLQQVRATSLEAFSHQELPFEKLVEGLRPARSPGYPPIVQVMFTLQDERATAVMLPGLTVTRLDTTTGTAKFDLSLMISETAQGLTLFLEYNRDLFDPTTAQRWLGHFETLLEGLLVNAARHVSEPALLTSAERTQLLQLWNDTVTDYPRDATIAALFEAQAAEHPDAIAVESRGEPITYRELNLRADALALRLRALGVGPDVVVALCVERSVAMIVALLGILKAGGAYAALEPEYPAERLALMLADLKPPVVLTQQSLLAKVPSSAAHVLCLDEVERVAPNARAGDLSDESTRATTRATAENLAYVSFTSGSSGPPKGVCITQRGVVRLVRSAAYATFGPDEVFLQLAPLGFDASTFEIWGALLNGARLVLYPAGPPSLTELGEFIAARRVTTLWLTAGLFHALVDHALASLRHVRQLLAGGDTLSPAHVQKVLSAFPACRLINGYGPTENTTFTCCHTITSVDGAIPLGRPIANTEAYVLDPAREPAPIGVPGELWVGGDGLARGYLNCPELTAEKFAAHPFRPGHRLYRTGDRARMLADGTIAFLGRSDRQVKLRGFRVELEEIEAQLGRHPGVRACAVTAPAGVTGERRLVAHVVAVDPAPSADDLRKFLQRSVPGHMVPGAFVFLPQLPLTASGKVDYRALPLPEIEAVAQRGGAIAPRDLWEQRMVKLWETVLGVSPIGVTDRFFDLGGHSLLAIRLIALIEKTFGRRLPVAAVFQAQSVEQLAALLRENRTPVPGQSLLAIQPEGRRAPLYLVHGVGGGMLWGYINLSRHLGSEQPVYVFRSNWATGEIRFETVEQMAARYVAELRTFQPQGPYAVGGYCFGGNIAFEMARLLEAQGQEVATVALLNSSPPNSEYYRFRWTPPGLVRFARNLVRWAVDFFRWDRKLRDQYVRWKLAQAKSRLAGWFGRSHATAPGHPPDEIVDLSGLPDEQRQLYAVHLRALQEYHCRPYGGAVTLFRTRGHPLLSSFDPHYGWDEFVRGGITFRKMPGGHESLLQEPHVQAVARELLALCDPKKLSAAIA
jgi:amino acid adenylation domain-containing protein